MPSAVHRLPVALSVSQTAFELSVSTKTVRRMLADGRLQPVRIGRRVLVASASIARLVPR